MAALAETAAAPARARVARARPVPPARPRSRWTAQPVPRVDPETHPRVAVPAAVRASNEVLDRLLRGHGWILCVGVLLVGIVFLNVRLLELDGRIARDSERVAALRQQNADLRLRAAALSSSERVQRAAAGRGLVLPKPSDLRFLRSRPGMDARLAAGGMVAPRAEPPAGPEGAPATAAAVTGE